MLLSFRASALLCKEANPGELEHGMQMIPSSFWE